METKIIIDINSIEKTLNSYFKIWATGKKDHTMNIDPLPFSN